MKTKDVSKLSIFDFGTWIKGKLKGTAREYDNWTGMNDK
jgi:hypothetical protein